MPTVPKALPPGNPMPLEIHTINVSQGDAILIINRDLDALGNKIDEWIKKQSAPKPKKPENSADWMPFAVAKNAAAKNYDIDLEGTVKRAVLIDAGNRQFGVNVLKYMKDHGVKNDGFNKNPKEVSYDTQKEFFAVISHYHDDHYDGFIYSKDKDDKVVNPHVVLYQFPPAKIYDYGQDGIFDPINYKEKSSYRNYREIIKDLVSKNGTKYYMLVSDENLNTEEKNNISLNTKDTNYNNFRLRCIASSGYIWDGSKKKSKRPASPFTGKNKDEQNSRSVTLVLEFGDFRFYLAGDLGGVGEIKNSETTGEDYGTKKATGSQGYWDIENPLADSLPAIYIADHPNRPNTVAGHICGLKCSHHGSQWHTNTKLLKVMQPKVCVNSSGLRQTFHLHPTQETLCRIDYDNTTYKDEDGDGYKNEYSPQWPDTTSGAPKNPAPINNTFKNSSALNDKYYYYITEMVKQGYTSKNKVFKRTYPNGRIVGSIVVRPYLSDILEIEKKESKYNSIRIQVYGSGEMSDIYLDDKSKKKRKYSGKLTHPEQKNANYPASFYYPVGTPWVHICNKH